MANVQNISIDGTSYSCRDNTKAPKSEAIKNITRSGTTFTATRCDGTTFTFTQQDNNTTTGTTYNAGSVPNNTTFGTNGSIKNAYDGLNSSKAPKSEAIKSITRSGTTFTATRCDGTTFTFTQQDNNTTSGTSYGADSIPTNNTFGTNSTIKNVRQEAINTITPNVLGNITAINGYVDMTNVKHLFGINITVQVGNISLLFGGFFTSDFLTADRVIRVVGGLSTELNSAQFFYSNSTKRLTLTNVYIGNTSYTTGINAEVFTFN